MNLRRAAVRGMMWLTIEGGATLLLSVMSLFVMGRIIGPTDFGIAAIAIAVVQFAGMFSEHMLQDALIQRHELTAEHESTAHTASLAIGLAAFLACVAAAFPLARLLNEPEFVAILIVSALPLPITGLAAVPTARLRREFHFRPLVTRTIASRMSGVVVGPALALLGFGAWSLVIQHIGGVVVSVALILHASPPNVKLGFRWARLRELMVVAGPVTATGVAHMLRDRIFLALVGTVLDVRAAGFVNMTFRLAGTLKDTVMVAVNSVGVSTFARQQDNAGALRSAFEDNRRFIALLAYPVFFGLFACADQIVPLVLGPAWQQLVPLMQAMALAAVFQLTVYQSEAVVVAIGRPVFATVFFSITAVAVTLAVPLIQPPSPLAALLIWIGAMIAAAPLWIAGVRHITGWSVATLLVPGARGLACAGAMAGIVLAADPLALAGLAELPRLLAKIVVGAAAYGLLTLAFNRPTLLHFVATLRGRGPGG